METTKRLTQNEWQGTGIAIMRIMVGIVLMAHGLQKLLGFGVAGTAGFLGQAGIPFPMVSAVLLIGAESLGGLALILGLFTRPAAAILAFNMAVAVFAVHLKGGFFLPHGFEYAATLMVANIAFVLTGAGAYALDNVLHTTQQPWRQ